jgi:hypothetical protein
MPNYLLRWLVAIFIVTPVMFALVPAAQLLFIGLEGPHADDPFWSHFLGMAGFYGGYALLAGSFVSLVHTWLVRRHQGTTTVRKVLWAVGLGVSSLLPQAAVFGPEYWGVNVFAGATAGALYGLLVSWRALYSI